MSEQEIILPSDPRAATRKTVEGWVSRDGFFYGDGPANERTARYAGSTHSVCGECGAVCEKSYVRCDKCRSRIEIDRYEAKEKRPWDGTQMIYSDARDEYYRDPEEAAWALDDGETLEDLRLVLCEPNHPRQLDEEFFADQLPEDGDWDSLPKELQAAVDAFNAVAAKCAPLSWEPGRYAMQLPEDSTND